MNLWSIPECLHPFPFELGFGCLTNRPCKESINQQHENRQMLFSNKIFFFCPTVLMMGCWASHRTLILGRWSAFTFRTWYLIFLEKRRARRFSLYRWTLASLTPPTSGKRSICANLAWCPDTKWVEHRYVPPYSRLIMYVTVLGKAVDVSTVRLRCQSFWRILKDGRRNNLKLVDWENPQPWQLHPLCPLRTPYHVWYWHSKLD